MDVKDEAVAIDMKAVKKALSGIAFSLKSSDFPGAMMRKHSADNKDYVPKAVANAIRELDCECEFKSSTGMMCRVFTLAVGDMLYFTAYNKIADGKPMFGAHGIFYRIPIAELDKKIDDEGNIVFER